MFVQQHNFGNELILRCGHTNGIHNSEDHLHQFCEIEMVLEGEIEITVEGKTDTAKAGDIAVITPFRIHSFHTPKYVKQLICVFSNSFISDFIPLEELCKSRDAAIFHASEHLWSYLVGNDFHNTKTKMSFHPTKDANYVHKLKSTLYLILSEYFNSVNQTGSSATNNTLSKILIYLSENYRENLSLVSVGAALGYSPKYISNCLRMIPGYSFRDLLNSMRINQAKIMLLNTDLNIITIAYECGFVSETSFHRVFLNLVGVSPKKYRSEHRQSKRA